jgi:hypothetical protein
MKNNQRKNILEINSNNSKRKEAKKTNVLEKDDDSINGSMPGAFPPGLAIPSDSCQYSTVNVGPPDNLLNYSSYNSPYLSRTSYATSSGLVDIDQHQYPPPQSYGPKHSQLGLFRYKTQQVIPLTEFGNLVVDVPVSQKVLSSINRIGTDFTHLRCKKLLN